MGKRILRFLGFIQSSYLVKIQILILEACEQCFCHLVIHPEMNHSSIFYREHICDPLMSFLNKIGVTLGRSKDNISFPLSLWEFPDTSSN